MNAWMAAGVVLGTGIGSVARYLLGRIPRWRGLPWGTIVANTLGAAVVGAVAALVARDELSPTVVVVVSAGLASGLTTFSALAIDALVLWRERGARPTAAYLAITLAAGIGAGALGWAAFQVSS